MAGNIHHKVLSNAFGREHLLEQGKRNGVQWQEDSHEGVNWMRFSGAVSRHMDEGKDFHIDDSDPALLNQMLTHYKLLKEMHKRTMVPHVRAAMQKLRMDSNDGSKGDMDYLNEAYAHLDANGGHHWSEKVSGLHSLNHHINHLTERLSKMGYQP